MHPAQRKDDLTAALQARRRARSLLRPAKRLVRTVLRSGFRRYVRARPRPEGVGADRRVFILLASAWGMGGTIRATHNLAGHLARTHEVELLSVFRRVERPFFEFPPGIAVTALDDQRSGVVTGARRVVRNLLARIPSALVHPADGAYEACSLWVDVMLARKLRGRRGILIGTRPGFNILAADLSPPGLVTVGQEHMHFSHHPRPLGAAMKRYYPRLDALAVLTDKDRREYEQLLGEGVRLTAIPNAAEIGGPKADLSAQTVLAAGRLTRQKGFDMLIPAFGRVARAHPGWRLRICGRGHLREELQQLVEEQGLGDVIELPGPRDLADEMAQASVFVLSSRFEGFPVVLLEAMSKGMAVVSFDCPTGPSEVVDDHENGILVPPRDVEGLAAAIAELMEDEELRRRCAAAALETAGSYTLEAIGSRWSAFLDEVAEAREERAGG